MNLKIGKWKIAAVFMCSVIAAGSLTYVNNNGYNDVKAKTIADLEEEMAANDAEIEALEGEIENLDDELANIEYEQSIIQEKIDLQTENLNIINTKIDDIKVKIDDTEKKIDSLEVDIKNKKKDIDVGLEQFKERLLAMYVTGNDSLTSALVGATDFYDMLSKIELISQVAKRDDELVTSLKTQLEQYEEAQTLLDIEKENLSADLEEQEKYQSEFTATITALNEDYQKSADYEAELQLEKTNMQSNIEQFEKDSAAKSAEIDKINEIARQQAEAAKKAEEEAARREEEEEEEEANNNYYEEDDNDNEYEEDDYYDDSDDDDDSYSDSDTSYDEIDSSTGDGGYSGSLTWPVPGHYVISSHYEYRWGSFHQGIDIADGNTAGAGVAAAESGTVTMVATGCSHDYGKDGSCGCNGGYGNYFMVDHGNGLSTFYAHCADVYVSVGQYVSRGEIIGTVGSTGWSTGAHLHFEVRINGSTANPTDYLY